jgi:hypothetical protein
VDGKEMKGAEVELIMKKGSHFSLFFVLGVR